MSAKAAWVVTLLVGTSALAGGPTTNTRHMQLSGGNSQTILPEPEHPAAWTPDSPIIGFVGSSKVADEYPISFPVWPTSTLLGKRRVTVGQTLERLRIACVVDLRNPPARASCVDGRRGDRQLLIQNARMEPAHLFEDSVASKCFRFQDVAPTHEELVAVERQLQANQSIDAAPFSRDGARAVAIVTTVRSVSQQEIRFADRVLFDVDERVDPSLTPYQPGFVSRMAGLVFAVPVTADGKPEATFAKVLMLGMSFPGKLPYVERALQTLDRGKLSPELRAVVLHDLAVSALVIGDVEEGRRALAELKRVLSKERLPKDLRTIVDGSMTLLDELASGEVVPFDPCIGGMQVVEYP